MLLAEISYFGLLTKVKSSGKVWVSQEKMKATEDEMKAKMGVRKISEIKYFNEFKKVAGGFPKEVPSENEGETRISNQPR